MRIFVACLAQLLLLVVDRPAARTARANRYRASHHAGAARTQTTQLFDVVLDVTTAHTARTRLLSKAGTADSATFQLGPALLPADLTRDRVGLICSRTQELSPSSVLICSAIRNFCSRDR